MYFIREKIKEKSINKKRKLVNIGLSIGGGLLFFTTVCTGALFLQSKVEATESTLIVEMRDTMEQLKEKKELPYIGLSIVTITEKISEDYDIPKGVFIKEITPDSPAMCAGLQSGDIITRINREIIKTDAEYHQKVSTLIPGMICEVALKRQNGNEYYDVTCFVSVGTVSDVQEFGVEDVIYAEP